MCIIYYIWATIKSFIFEAMSLFVPKKRMKNHQGPKWFNSDIRHHLKCLRTKRRKFNSRPTLHQQNSIEASEDLLQQKMVQAKSNFERKLIESLQSGDSTAIYSYIRSFSGNGGIPSTMNLNNSCAVSNYDKACFFNRYFHSVFTKSSFQLPPVHLLPRPQSYIGDITISESDVFCALTSLDPTKAMGTDGISPRLLKVCALPLLQPLHHLFSQSLTQYYIPLEWRTHLIKPLFKSGDRHFIRNYRPISLLCVVSKVLEKIVYNHLIEFVRKSVTPYQFGFLQGRSTLQQLLVFFNTVVNSADNSSQTDVVYLDFKKAFDSVAHNELLCKLWHFGITDSLWMWIHAYLSNRLQYVSVGQSVSDVLPVISGVPQGSILGPLLFLIFINDLPTFISSSKVLLFADDAKCLMPISSMSDCSSLQRDLNRLAEWSSIWNLHFNEEKCSVIRFNRKRSSTSTICKYSINNKPVSSNDSHMDLGIIMSANLQWRPHYELVISRSYKKLGLLRRIFSTVKCISAKRSLYLSFIRSQLLYCSSLWRPQHLMDITHLESVQRRATRFIVDDKSMDYRDRLTKLNLLPLMMEYEIADILFFVNSIKTPHGHFDITNYVNFSVSNTRSSTYLKLRHSTSKRNYQSHFYFNRFPRLWNSLPSFDIHLSISTIKSKLRLFFWNQFLSKFDPYNTCTYHYLCPCQKCSKLPVNMHFNHSML